MSNSRTNVDLLKNLLLLFGGTSTTELSQLLTAVAVDANGNIVLGAAADDTTTVSGPATFNANPAGRIVGGVYTPTLTGISNAPTTTAYECQYMRIGTSCAVSGRLSVDPTSATTATNVGISLPFASALTAFQQCAGIACRATVSPLLGYISGDFSNDRAQLDFVTDATVTNQDFYFIFLYQIL